MPMLDLVAVLHALILPESLLEVLRGRLLRVDLKIAGQVVDDRWVEEQFPSVKCLSL